MTIYLIRHGQTEANEKHLYCGSTDLSLSESGIAGLRDRGCHVKNARFITSGMKRTNETLRILFGDVPFETDPRFREMDFGIFEMRGYGELKDDPAYQAWLTGDNERNVTPGGESGEQMCCRVLEALKAVQADGRDAVIVSHGGVIAVIMAQLFPGERRNRYQWQPEPGKGYRITDGRFDAIP